MRGEKQATLDLRVGGCCELVVNRFTSNSTGTLGYVGFPGYLV